MTDRSTHRRQWRGILGLAVMVLAAVVAATAAGGFLEQMIDRRDEAGPGDAEATEATQATEVDGSDVPPAPDEGDGSGVPSPEMPGVERGPDNLEVHFIDVGQADATLFVHADAAVLIDAGHWLDDDLVAYLAAVGITRLDLVVITHPHADHLGQFDQVLDGLDVDEVWWSGSVSTTRTFERSLAALERSDAAYEEPRAGDVATIGPLVIDVINPPEGVDIDDFHDAGLAVVIRFDHIRFVLTGDAEVATEQRMVATAGSRMAGDVLKLGHHGSSTSSSRDFLEAVSPSVAVWSAGLDNPYGHPHTEVIARLDAARIPSFGTADYGDLVVITDGKRWWLEAGDGVIASGVASPPTLDGEAP